MFFLWLRNPSVVGMFAWDFDAKKLEGLGGASLATKP
jgi:hypothetical protein